MSLPGHFRGTVSLLLWLAATLGVSCAGAQTPVIDASNLKQPTSFDEGWLVQGGDEPVWADPHYDDSRWQRINTRAESVYAFFPNKPPVVWYRLHLKVDPLDTSFAFAESNIADAFEIYSNGQKILQTGSVSPYLPYTFRAHLLESIPPAHIAAGMIVIAVRTHISPREWQSSLPGVNSENLVFGQMSALHDQVWMYAFAWYGTLFIQNLFRLAMLGGAVLLFSAQRLREYLFLALVYATALLEIPIIFYSVFHTYPIWWNILGCLVAFVAPWLVLQMYMAFVELPVSLWMNLLAILTGIANGTNEAMVRLEISIPAIKIFLSLPLFALFAIVLPVTLIREARRGNRDAGILIVPVVLEYAHTVIGNLLYALAGIHSLGNWAWQIFLPTVVFQIGPLSILWDSVADTLSMFSLALIILLRSNRQSRKQALLETEIANAREVQQVILPEAVEAVPGFHIESVYEPAQEVGGDFFQVLPDGNGGLLAVVGDVAGKGIPAAMLVSVLVGAIRSVAEFTMAPDQMLVHLNRRLQGRTKGGFSTAIAAHITANGAVTIANAGHLPPYLDGREIELPGALPLGIDAKVSYEAHTFALAPGSRLVFYSDGVVEAQNAKGELLGFERAAALSRDTASQIVHAAKQFGQADDITVVAIAREAATAAAA